MPLPELESRRLKLRAFQETDIEDLFGLWIYPEVRRYLWDDQEISRDFAVETIRASLLSVETEDLGMWMLSKKDTRSVLGFCGFRRIPTTCDVELLYGLWPQFWGQGLATVASQAAITRLFEKHDIDRVVAGTDTANLASLRVMRRLEMTPLPGGIAAVPSVQYYELRRTAEFANRCAAQVSRWDKQSG